MQLVLTHPRHANDGVMAAGREILEAGALLMAAFEDADVTVAAVRAAGESWWATLQSLMEADLQNYNACNKITM